MRQLFVLLTSLWLAMHLAGSPAAHAAGFYIGDVGARGMARAGSYVAAPDSMLALHYNVAGLALLEPGFNAEANLTGVGLDYRFMRTCPCADSAVVQAKAIDTAVSTRFRAIENSASPQLIPFFGIGYKLPYYDTTVAFGVYAPTSPGRLKYGEAQMPTAQRYSLIEFSLYEVFYQLAVAAQPFRGFRIGGMIMLSDFHATQVVNLYPNHRILNPSVVESFENPGYDVLASVFFEAPLQIGFGAGISYSPTFFPKLSIGASMLSQRKLKGTGTIDIQVPRDLPAVEIFGQSLDVELSLAGEFRVGVQYDEPELFELEAAVVIEPWSALERLVYRGKDVAFSLNGERTAFGELVVNTGLRDTFSARVGGEWKLWAPAIVGRAGYFFEIGSAPEPMLDVAVPDLAKHGFAVGFSTSWYGATLDVGANYVVLAEQRVVESKRKQVGALPIGVDPVGDSLLTTVGNGTYSGNYLILGTSLSVSLDKTLMALGYGSSG